MIDKLYIYGEMKVHDTNSTGTNVKHWMLALKSLNN